MPRITCYRQDPDQICGTRLWLALDSSIIVPTRNKRWSTIVVSIIWYFLSKRTQRAIPHFLESTRKLLRVLRSRCHGFSVWCIQLSEILPLLPMRDKIHNYWWEDPTTIRLGLQYAFINGIRTRLAKVTKAGTILTCRSRFDCLASLKRDFATNGILLSNNASKGIISACYLG